MELTHLDNKGNARMVDVSEKTMTNREATASGKIFLSKDTIERISLNNMPKGDVLSTARIAGIMAAKKTWELIPMCHNIPIDSISINFEINEEKEFIEITAIAKCVWKTGIEMEALTATTVAGLTIYDMCKAVDKKMTIGDIRLIKKSGGKKEG